MTKVHYIQNNGKPATLVFSDRGTAERYAACVKQAKVEHEGTIYVPRFGQREGA